jgi:hypothetical protein
MTLEPIPLATTLAVNTSSPLEPTPLVMTLAVDSSSTVEPMPVMMMLCKREYFSTIYRYFFKHQWT